MNVHAPHPASASHVQHSTPHPKQQQTPKTENNTQHTNNAPKTTKAVDKTA